MSTSDDHQRVQARASVRRLLVTVDGVVQTNALHPDNLRTPLGMAALTYVLILLNDCLWISANVLGCRVADKGEDFGNHGREGDLTSLIAAARNAACHMGSPLKNVLSGRLDFLIQVGRGTAVHVVEKTSEGPKEFSSECPYDDEIVVSWGEIRLMMVRNLKLSFDRLVEMHGAGLELRSVVVPLRPR